MKRALMERVGGRVFRKGGMEGGSVSEGGRMGGRREREREEGRREGEREEGGREAGLTQTSFMSS